jgi:hypothetical protein
MEREEVEQIDSRRAVRINAIQLIAVTAVNEIDYRVTNLTFHNLTPKGTSLPHGIKKLLGLSLRFCPTPTPIPQQKYDEALPQLIRQIRLRYQFTTSNAYDKLTFVPNPQFEPRAAPAMIEQLMDQIKTDKVSTTINKQNKILRWNINKRQRELLHTLCNNKKFKILNTDKNLGPAIMTMQQYQEFCMEHLIQEDIYEQVAEIQVNCIRSQVKKFYAWVMEHYPQEKAKIMIHNIENTTAAYFHGIPKIHKQPMGCRPIVSNLTSPTQGISKWLTVKLRPFAARIRSFVRDSSSIQSLVASMEVNEKDEVYTFDVESMYTSIPIKEAIETVKWFIHQSNTEIMMQKMIIQGLYIVLTCNFFTFGSRFFKQNRGLAMGTPVAPILATLYLGYYEERKIIDSFKNNLILYKRYLDDVLVIWRPDDAQPYEFKKFCAYLKRVPGLSWTHEKHTEQANFLDLWIYRGERWWQTRTHQKTLNLYLYPTATSAHPMGTKKGLIYGLLKKYKEQNSKFSDFKEISSRLFQRLLRRGYRYKTLRDMFVQSLRKLDPRSTKRLISTLEGKFFFKIPFDPNGPTKEEVRKHYQLDRLSQALENQGKGRIVICYTKPRCLANILMRTRLRPEQTIEPGQDECA